MSETVARRVVVAEDEALIRMDIVEVLRENGFDVVGEAADGEAAIALTRELRPDLVVMDITMPKMDGLTAAEAIGKERLAPVVMLTAFAQPEFVARAVEAGAIAYVVKPFTPERLLPQIEVALSRHQELLAVEAEVTDALERLETRNPRRERPRRVRRVWHVSAQLWPLAHDRSASCRDMLSGHSPRPDASAECGAKHAQQHLRTRRNGHDADGGSRSLSRSARCRAP